MRTRILVTTCVAALGMLAGGDLLACGDKFLSSGRGTRYQRPKTARAASILIYYSGPETTGVPRPEKLQSLLKHGGHRSTTVGTLDQLSAILEGGRFDVVLAANDAAAAVQQLIGTSPAAAIVLALEASPKERTLLQAIDKAVEQRDRNLKKSQTRI